MNALYANCTFEEILQRMKARVLAADPNMDTREGSIVHVALAPAAVELQNMYIALDVILNETFADTAQRPYLILRAKERALEPYPATNAVLRAEMNMDVPLGMRFSCDGLVFEVTQRIAMGVYQLRCEAAGVAGNTAQGALVPVDYIDGLTTANLVQLLIPGQDAEETEHFRARYFASLSTQTFGGNAADYQIKVKQIPGVGGVKVTPAWAGGGTVLLTDRKSTRLNSSH